MIEFERSADVLDIASANAQMEIEAALANRKKTGPAATGRCLYCLTPTVDDDTLEQIAAGYPVPEGTARFCDAECRDGYEHEQKMNRIAGKS